MSAGQSDAAEPRAVLFACRQNVIRSPMAAGLMRHYFGHSTYVASCGVRTGDAVDPFAVEVMSEIGIDMAGHVPLDFDSLQDTNFDLVISLAPVAHHRALEMTRTMAIEAEFWPTADPSLIRGNREQILASYRGVRDDLLRHIEDRFDAFAPPNA